MGEVGGMVFEQLRAQTDTKAKRRGPDLGDQFLEGVGLVAEPPPEGPVQSVLGSRPMQLLVGLGRQEVIDGAEGFRRWQADDVAISLIERAAAAKFDDRRD